MPWNTIVTIKKLKDPMKVENDKYSNGRKWVLQLSAKFLSLYLPAFMVSPFSFTTGTPSAEHKTPSSLMKPPI